MKTNLVVGLIVSSLGAILNAQSAVSTDPVGFVTVTVPANSDAVLAVPLYRSAAFKGKIQAISGSTLTVAGNPAWAANQFVQALPGQTDTFAVLIATGAKEGLIAKVTANSTHQLTIELPVGENLAGIKTNDADGAGEGDDLDVMPYWTPSTLLSAATPNGTELFAFDNTTVGTNVSPTSLLQFFSGFGWYNTISFTDQSHRPLLFGTSLILRNNAAAAFSVSIVGSVPMSAHRYTLRILAANRVQDQSIGFSSPVPEPLANLNLGAQNFDELFLFDNAATGKNKAPSQLLLHFGGRWYNSINFADVTDQVVLQPGSGMIYRLAAAGQTTQFVWQKLQSYLANN